MWNRDEAYADRREAGRLLGQLLRRHVAGDESDRVLVLGLPRGGVPVAAEVAAALNAPLDVFVVRKLGTPGQRELAMGAIASGGIKVFNDDVLRYLSISEAQIDAIVREEERELVRRESLFRHGRALPSLTNRVVILVDDGLATGSTMRAAALAVRQQAPARVIIAVPVGAPETCEELRAAADEVVCARTPYPFSAVGQWYRDFTQTSDEEVRQLLEGRQHVEPRG